MPLSPSLRSVADWWAGTSPGQRQALTWGLGLLLVTLGWLGSGLLYIALHDSRLRGSPLRLQSRRQVLRSIRVLKASFAGGASLALSPLILAFAARDRDWLFAPAGWFAVGLAVLWTVQFASGWWTSRDAPELGVTLGTLTHPRLYALALEAVRKVGIPPFDDVILAPDASMEVAPGNVLRIGYEALRQLTIPQLQSSLVHECAHIAHGDLAFKDAAIEALGRSIPIQKMPLHEFNPFCSFLAVYTRILYRHLAAHFQQTELDADDVEVSLYGGATSARSLEQLSDAGDLYSAATRVAGSLLRWGYKASLYDTADAFHRLETPALRAWRLGDLTPEEGILETHPALAERLSRMSERDSIPPLEGVSALTLVDDDEACHRRMEALAWEALVREPENRHPPPEPQRGASSDVSLPVIEAMVAAFLGKVLFGFDAPAGEQMLAENVEKMERLMGPSAPCLAPYLFFVVEQKVKVGERDAARALAERVRQMALGASPPRRATLIRNLRERLRAR
jgi:Zn-dependent protease with chaperone function